MGLIVKFVRLAIVVSIAFGLVYVDVQIHDNDFSRSTVGQTLKTYGGYEYGLLSYETCLDRAKWIKEKAPIYLEIIREWSKPYYRLLHDISLVTFNVTCGIFNSVTTYINKQYPMAEYWYIYYLGYCFLPNPLSGIIQGYSLILQTNYLLPASKVQKNLPEIRDASYKAAVIVIETTRNRTHQAVSYLQNDLFVGSWSADNIRNLTLDAFTSSQKYASTAIARIYETLSSLSSSSTRK